jgi:hypothetical protein
MADNKKLKGWQDDVKIDPHDANELAYIKRKHGYTAGNVVVAIHVTGSHSRKVVITWLKNNWSRIKRSKAA